MLYSSHNLTFGLKTNRLLDVLSFPEGRSAALSTTFQARRWGGLFSPVA